MKTTTLKFLMLSMFLLLGTWMAGQTKISVTFKVDMAEAEDFNPATDDIYISGSFADWAQPGSDESFKMSTGLQIKVYELTLDVDSGEIMYKYFIVRDNTPSWDNGEWNGEPNRKAIVTGESTYFDYWGQKPVFVTFNVDMTDADPFDPQTDDVYIAGSLANDWATPGSIPQYMMAPSEGNNMIYTVTLQLYTGDYEYKYFRVINGTPGWDNGEWNGDPNRTIPVVDSDTINDIWAVLYPGIFESKATADYKMYPNPVEDILNIDDVTDVNKIVISDASGKLIESVSVNSNRVSISTSGLNSGVYIVSFYTEKGILTSKFMKK
ncbi:MAG: T9SS type A sorting domain-containing protein [Chlorobi bacterium]|nr:T9SS type A sorting domain-containing protein [Chlorobiota bacterium]